MVARPVLAAIEINSGQTTNAAQGLVRLAHAANGVPGNQRAAHQQDQPDQQAGQRLHAAVTVGMIVIGGLGGQRQAEQHESPKRSRPPPIPVRRRRPRWSGRTIPAAILITAKAPETNIPVAATRCPVCMICRQPSARPPSSAMRARRRSFRCRRPTRRRRRWPSRRRTCRRAPAAKARRRRSTPR